jgi:hypothetical protein
MILYTNTLMHNIKRSLNTWFLRDLVLEIVIKFKILNLKYILTKNNLQAKTNISTITDWTA